MSGAPIDAAAPQPPKPSYRFMGDTPPPALAYLRKKPVWVCWNHLWDGQKDKWTKPPLSGSTGRKQKGTFSAPAFCVPFDVALATMRRMSLAGIGISLEHAGLVGADLDHCITDAGSYTPIAAEVLGYGETYAEVSPSGEGVHFLAYGKIAKPIKRDDLKIELYAHGRYFTVTRNHLAEAPETIAAAPRLIARLAQLDADTPKPGAQPAPPKVNGRAKPAGADYFANVNSLALAQLDRWVPELHPTARKQATGAWRVASAALGRDLEEDLSYAPGGIRDFGEEHGITAIDAVIRYGAAGNAADAAQWLCQHIGVEPSALGFSAGKKPPVHQPNESKAAEAAPSCDWSNRVIDSATLIGKPAPPRTWCVEEWLPEADVTLLGADGGAGKTTLAVMLGCARAWGQPWLDLPTAPGNTLHLFAEEDDAEAHFRFEKASAIYTGPQLHKFHMLPLATEDCTLAVPGEHGAMTPTLRVAWLETFIAENAVGLAMIDATADTFGGDEMSRSHVRSFIRMFRALAIRRRCTVLLTAHPSVEGMRTGRGYSGSTHWNNAVRSRLYFTTPKAGDEDEPADPDLRCLTRAKTNRARPGAQIHLRWSDHRYEVTGGGANLDQLLTAKRVFMELLMRLALQNRPVSDKPGSNYAPVVFDKEPEAKGLTKTALDKAMRALFAEGRIKVMEDGPTSRRRRWIEAA